MCLCVYFSLDNSGYNHSSECHNTIDMHVSYFEFLLVIGYFFEVLP